MADQALAKNFSFDFKIIDDWATYNSSRDKTNLAENCWVRGSVNVYKKLSGTIANRPGQKRLGPANSTFSPMSSEYVWNTSWGATLPVVVTEGRLQVMYEGAFQVIGSTGGATRYVFDKWFDYTQAKDSLLFVSGTSSIGQWTGGITPLLSGAFDSGVVAQLTGSPTNGGLNYNIGDIVAITGGGGTGATAKVTALTSGAVLTVGVVFGGNFYTVGDVLTLQGGNTGSGATVQVSTIGSAGEITAVTLLTGGTGFLVGFNYQVAGGTGIRAIIKAATVSTIGTVEALSLVTGGTGYSTGTGYATTGGTGTGLTVGVLTVAKGSIKKQSAVTTFQQDGFSSSGTINVNGTSYGYQYELEQELVGISADPSSISAGLIGLQSIVYYKNTPSFGFSNDFIKVINNQVYTGSYSSRLCYISSSTDFRNYAVPSPRSSGSPELLTLDAPLKGIGVRQGNAHIGIGTGGWAVVSFNDITVGTTLTQQTKVDVKPISHLCAPFSHEYIDSVGDDLIYLSQDQQVRMFTDANDAFSTRYPAVSQEIFTELAEENPVGGALKCIGDFTYITFPNTGRMYMRQVRKTVNEQGQVVAEILWHAPWISNFTRVDEINGVEYGFSNANPQVYQIWDTGQWHDDSPTGEPLPYMSILALSYRGETRRQGLWSFDKHFTEGYCTEGTTLSLRVNYNYQGALNRVDAIINSIDNPAFLFTPNSGTASSLGDESLGDEILGDGIVTTFDEQDALPKFKVINSLPLINYFEMQPVFSSDTADARWEILATGTNAKVNTDENSNYIINKRRTN